MFNPSNPAYAYANALVPAIVVFSILVVPRPTVFIPAACAVSVGNTGLLKAFNTWLLAKQAEGAVRKLYRHWMLGGAAETEKVPRWSVIRKVLGGVD